MWAIEQYHKDLIKKMGLKLESGSVLLDVGCGDGEFTKYLTTLYKLQTKGIDVDININWDNSDDANIRFEKGSIYELPFENNTFDYVFFKDILHHIDEPKHDSAQFKKAFNEIKRVCKPNGRIIILEANRYNPLFYPHMVILEGHDHLRYTKLMSIISNSFKIHEVKSFESHVYPKFLISIFRLYEIVMENAISHKFRAYTLIDIMNEGKKNEK